MEHHEIKLYASASGRKQRDRISLPLVRAPLLPGRDAYPEILSRSRREEEAGKETRCLNAGGFAGQHEVVKSCTHEYEHTGGRLEVLPLRRIVQAVRSDVQYRLLALSILSCSRFIMLLVAYLSGRNPLKLEYMGPLQGTS